MPTLILSLPLATGSAGAAPEYDYVLSPDGQSLGAQGRAAADLLPTQGARGAEVVAVVPARALSWHGISLPARVLQGLLSGRTEPARARGVLAGLLEEQLLDEPERLHFAVLQGSGDGPQAWAAVCDRAWLQAHVQALEAAGYSVSRIVAECTPTAMGTARALLSDAMEPAQLTLCTAQGVSLLPLLGASLGLAKAQADLDVLAEPPVMALAQQHFGNQVLLQTKEQRLLFAAQSPWNLAQLELSGSSNGRLRKGLAAAWQQVCNGAAWRPLRWGVVALLLVQVVALNALAWQQRQQQDRQRTALQDMLQQTFPDIRLVVDAPLQMQRAVDDLARAHGVGTDTDLSRVLSMAGPLAPQGLNLTAIELSDKELRLSTNGLDTAQAQPLLSALEARGLQSRLQDGQLLITAKESR